MVMTRLISNCWHTGEEASWYEAKHHTCITSHFLLVWKISSN